MPPSRRRKKPAYTPPPPKAAQQARAQRRWIAPAMVVCFLLGLAWLVVFYVAGDRLPGLSALGNWNILVGMALIAVGFGIATQWQ